MIRISGRNLGLAVKVNAQLDAGRLPFVLGGAIVFFGEAPAALISVQNTSIVCFVPFEIAQPAQVTVSLNGTLSNSVRVGVQASASQILSIANQDGTPNSAANPAYAGSVITLYVSGLGQTNPPGVDGLRNSRAAAGSAGARGREYAKRGDTNPIRRQRAGVDRRNHAD
ncbi:MAG: hypothetical protein JO307_09480 [Bryobacterales bacterium]|nr:hypothetical protein [Bryobacterales bacterium]MBV9401536.1 hypothetical protein [Bryobacterales bacterium]